MKNYYFLASLPTLSLEYSEQPAILICKFWQNIQEENKNLVELVQSILLQQDIANLEKLANGYEPLFCGTISNDILHKAKSDLSVLNGIIPESILQSISLEKWQQNVWGKFFAYQKKIALKHKSCLFSWIEWEIGLRKYIATTRAESLGTTVSSLVKSLDNTSACDYQKIMTHYHKETSPLGSEQFLDSERWKYADSLAIPYSFDNDEVVVYAIKLLILERWWAVSQSQIDIFEKVANG